MLTITKKISTAPAYDFSALYNIEDILFFDIETTGFAAETTYLYLIGAAYYKDSTWNTIQWFADDNGSELSMLHSFFSFLKDYKLLLHYNGNGFDIPYLLKKCASYHLTYHFNDIISLDIYKQIKPYKKYLKLENLKQKTIEKFLGLQREDQYSGGELIKVYGNYLKAQIQNLPELNEYFNLLCLHNEEDIKGLLFVVQILNYSDLFLQQFTVWKAELTEQELILFIKSSCNLPKRISYGNDTLYFSAFKENITIKIQLYKNELKFFYQNYKDYYYLPAEDTAIHKSVAFYVDKDFRTKARAANCYSKKTGSFIPQYEEILTPYFKIDFYDTITYAETTEELLNNKQALSLYAKHLILHI